MTPTGRRLHYFGFMATILLLLLATGAQAQAPRATVEVEGLPLATMPVAINGTTYTEIFDVSFLLEDAICPGDATFLVSLEATTIGNNTTVALGLTPAQIQFQVPAAPYLVESFQDSAQATLVVTASGLEAPGGNATINIAADLPTDAHGCVGQGDFEAVPDAENPFSVTFSIENHTLPEPTPSPVMPGPGLVLGALAALSVVAVTARRRP